MDETDDTRPTLAPLALAAGLVLGALGGYSAPHPARPRMVPPPSAAAPVPPPLAGLADAARALRVTLAAEQVRVARAIEAGELASNDDVAVHLAAARKPLAAEAARQLSAAVRAGCDADGDIPPANRAKVGQAIRVYAAAYGGTD